MSMQNENKRACFQVCKEWAFAFKVPFAFHILYTLAVTEVDTENMCIWFHDQNNDPVLSPHNISLQDHSNITTECFCYYKYRATLPTMYVMYWEHLVPLHA